MEYNLQPQAAVGGGVKNSSAVVVTVESMGIPF